MGDSVFPSLPELDATGKAMKYCMHNGDVTLSIGGRYALSSSLYKHGTVEFGCARIKPNGHARSWVRTEQWTTRQKLRNGSRHRFGRKRLEEHFETWEEGYARYMEIRAACLKLFPITE